MRHLPQTPEIPKGQLEAKAASLRWSEIYRAATSVMGVTPSEEMPVVHEDSTRVNADIARTAIHEVAYQQVANQENTEFLGRAREEVSVVRSEEEAAQVKARAQERAAAIARSHDFELFTS